MNCKLELHEKLKDLRSSRKWTLAYVEEKTGIPTSTLQRLESENDDSQKQQRISHLDIMTLAKLYDVSMDYLFGVTGNRQHRNIEVDKLRLSDEAIEVLSGGKINNRLISEFLAHPEFPQLLSSMEIYIDRKIAPQIGTMNGLYKLAEETIRDKFKASENDEILATLQEAVVDEDEFLRYRISERFNAVMKSLFDAHKKDALTVEQEGVLRQMKDDIQIYFDNNSAPTMGKLAFFAKQMGLNVSHLTEEQVKVLISALETSEIYKRKVKKRKIV